MFCQLFERLEENGERSLCRMNEDAWISASIDEEHVKQPLMESQLAESATTANGKKDHPDEEDKDHKAPLGLLMEFLKALKDKDFQLAFRLCQMTLIYEPTNPEAAEILPLLQQKLLEEQGTEESSEEEEDEDDSKRDERSSCTSSCSTSSSSSDNDEEDPDDSEKEKHK